MARPRSRDGKIVPNHSFGTVRTFDPRDGRPIDTPPRSAAEAAVFDDDPTPIPSPQGEIIMSTPTTTTPAKTTSVLTAPASTPATTPPAATMAPAVQTPPSSAIAVPIGLPFAPEAWAALAPEERDAMIALYRDEMEEDRSVGIDRKVFQIKFPQSGGREFEIPDPTGDGEPTFAIAIEAAVIWSQPIRDYYPEGQKLGLPPLCASPDRLRPYPSPTAQARNCATCRWNEWGSGRNGEGKGCKEKYRLFVLRAGETMPRVLTLPTMSAKEYETYTTLLKVKRLVLSAVQTTFTITRGENSAKTPYPLAVMKDGAVLAMDDFKRVTGMRAACKTIAEDFGMALSVEVEDESPKAEPGEGNDASLVIDHETGEVIDGKAQREQAGF